MELKVEASPLLESDKHERWVYEVTIQDNDLPIDPRYTVYMDSERIYVGLPDYMQMDTGLTRQDFNWNDYMLENCTGDIKSAAIICALAVHAGAIEV